MTICIAAVCDQGKTVVTATDGLLSMGDVIGETVAAKMIWVGQWQFMYAGLPGNIAMILGEIDELQVNNPGSELLSRARVQRTVKVAFIKLLSNASSFENLAPFDMTLDEFKKEGLASLGRKTHEELSSQIRVKAQTIQDQLLVTGWGHTPHSAMLYEVSGYGDSDHAFSGIAAIGSGSRVAQSYLLTLGQGRDRTLAETIFNVAMAKFASEKSQDLDVGQRTAIYVSRKSDDPKDFHADPLMEKETSELRKIWEDRVRPRMPMEGRDLANQITRRISGTVQVSDILSSIQAHLAEQSD